MAAWIKTAASGRSRLVADGALLAATFAIPERHPGGQLAGAVTELDAFLHQVLAHLLAAFRRQQEGQAEPDRHSDQESGHEPLHARVVLLDRKSTRLNSSHVAIS